MARTVDQNMVFAFPAENANKETPPTKCNISDHGESAEPHEPSWESQPNQARTLHSVGNRLHAINPNFETKAAVKAFGFRTWNGSQRTNMEWFAEN